MTSPLRPCPSEEFNDKILSPDLSDAELQRLHGEVLHIYETYCLDESIDKISFDKFIVEEIRNSKSTLHSLHHGNCSVDHGAPWCSVTSQQCNVSSCLSQSPQVRTAAW